MWLKIFGFIFLFFCFFGLLCVCEDCRTPSTKEWIFNIIFIVVWCQFIFWY